VTNDQVQRERELRITAIAMTPVLAAPFVVLFYFLYLKEMGIEVQQSTYANYGVLALAIGSVVGLTLNEVFLKLNGGKFKLRRLVFRWTLLISYLFLLWTAYFLLTLLFPWVETIFQFMWGMLAATAIFVTMIVKLRHLFNRLDKGEG